MSALRRLAAWLGGWGRLALLALALAGLLGGLIWERWRHPPVMPGASQVAVALNVDIRQTSYWSAEPAGAIRGFYRQALAARGWRYCGTQATEGCSNLPRLANRSGAEIDVYRRTDSRGAAGSTVEISPVDGGAGRTHVTIYETRGP